MAHHESNGEGDQAKMNRKYVAIILVCIALVGLISFIVYQGWTEEELWKQEQWKYANQAYDCAMHYFFGHNFTVVYGSYHVNGQSEVLLYKTSEFIEVAETLNPQIVFSHSHLGKTVCDIYIWFIHNGTIYRYEYPLER